METRIDEGPERVRTCGVGCLIFGALELVVVEVDGRDAAGGISDAAAGRTCSACCSRVEKSMSGPKSSSMVVHATERNRNLESLTTLSSAPPPGHT